MRVWWRARVPVVVQGRLRRRAAAARVLWAGAEVAVTVGLVLLLLVVHQLWWTNRQAQQAADRTVQALEQEWGSGGTPGGEDSTGSGDSTGSTDSAESAGGDGGQQGADDDGSAAAGSSSGAGTRTRPAAAPRWDQAYAVLAIPRLGLRVPVAEGVSKGGVLDKGYAGHYPGTAQPGRAGNFALAGHRNTHGEPFRYINRLQRGDEMRVETKTAVYTYVVDKTLPQTTARDGSVIASVPRSQVRTGYGYREPGYYLTLTTCTPEYTSKYRLVVWGKLQSMRPR
ncbi:class E sortase [Streptomyces jeddahensis]|uniref:Sortase family protein n=1 Tax=Streptomyces jeddahensis TaxID=1716141 RepID=A0A177HRP0_9ACTN|nr:class E sortase [Streptomyces jeddahensis]OAH13396.1 sortase family protein [Streptomyces jeddahensis]